MGVGEQTPLDADPPDADLPDAVPPRQTPRQNLLDADSLDADPPKQTPYPWMQTPCEQNDWQTGVKR